MGPSRLSRRQSRNSGTNVRSARRLSGQHRSDGSGVLRNLTSRSNVGGSPATTVNGSRLGSSGTSRLGAGKDRRSHRSLHRLDAQRLPERSQRFVSQPESLHRYRRSREFSMRPTGLLSRIERPKCCGRYGLFVVTCCPASGMLESTAARLRSSVRWWCERNLFADDKHSHLQT
ncbi:UNVERIFIED_CONTAM: hypothetical protein GTU68_034163 [Idotea baltica]|nr:hypothetical protein [Idotea baltica]